MTERAPEERVSRLVNLVMYQSSPDAPTPRMRQNFLSEQVFEWAGVGPVHLRATVFHENVARLVHLSLPGQGAIRLPWGKESTLLPLVAAEDVARIAVGLLTSSSWEAGTAYPVIGEAIALRELIATFARVLNRDVHYQEVTDDEWRVEALARGWNAHAVEHLSALWRSLRASAITPEAGRFAVTDTIERIGGAKPKTFEQFICEHLGDFTV